MSRIILLLARPPAAARTSDVLTIARATFVQSLREKSHITPDGLETHRANTVTAIRTELNRFP